ncbi:tetratricopeptide repeat protein [Alteromonas oceanisediminis]|uniref:tetratricopeptide repeat protein n=1 Tax=Alteromonas oceanisediminis TaxID=2836180 RepID=UPI001BDB3439|nr:class I SAM-dependent methyltransferase [Alteromonas oceanisediminis]MBT0586404.1 class I SAM-dependent methyltransferase [Alteromonas oceanisediminis]
MLNPTQHAESLYNNEDYQAALALYQSIQDNSAHVQWNIARCQWKLGDYHAALSAFESAFNKESSLVHAMSLANAHIMLGSIEKARQLLVRINMAQPGFANAAVNLSLLQFCEQRRETAIKTVERAFQHNPSDPNILITLYAFYTLTQSAQAKALLGHLPHDIRTQSHRTSIDFISEQIAANPKIKLTSSTLENLSLALQHAKLEGSVIECGVYYGRSINYLAAEYAGVIDGFDSFNGLPEKWKADEAEGSYSTGGQLPDVATNVKLHQGWFDDTLPEYAKTQSTPIKLLHIDCDIYSSTKTIFDCLGGLIQSGTVIVFDEFLGYPEYQQHEFKAFYEFIESSGLEFEFVSFSLLPHEATVRIIS